MEEVLAMKNRTFFNFFFILFYFHVRSTHAFVILSPTQQPVCANIGTFLEKEIQKYSKVVFISF